MDRNFFNQKWGQINREEADRKWKMYLREQEEQQLLLEALRVTSMQMAGAGGSSQSTGEEIVYVISGPNSVSSLYTVDLATGTLNLIGSTSNNYHTGIAVHPETGDLWSVTNPPAGRKLWKVNKETGVATEIGDTTAQIPDITIKSNGTIIGWAEDWNNPGNTVDVPVSLDPATGLATALTPSFIATGQTGVANGSNTGTILVQWSSNTNEMTLSEVDLTTGAATTVCLYTDLPDAGNIGCTFSNGLTDRSDGSLLAIQRVNIDYGRYLQPFRYGINSGPLYSGLIRAVKIQPDGKLFVGGSIPNFGATPTYGLTRHLVDGTLDTSFTSTFYGTGTFEWSLGSPTDPDVYDVAVQEDGKIVVVGTFDTVFGATHQGVFRLNSDGSEDTAFSAAIGTAATSLTTNSGRTARFVKIQPDGKILLGGDLNRWKGVVIPQGIARLNADGTLDTAFQTNLGTGPGDSKDYFNDMDLQEDGKIVMVGVVTGWNGDGINRRIIRFNSDGTVDTSFDSALGTQPNSDTISVAIDSTGLIYVGGKFTSIGGVAGVGRFARLLPTGALDTSFDTATGTGFSKQINKIQIFSDDSVLCQVYNDDTTATYNGTTLQTKWLARIFSDGTLDTDFSDDLDTTANIASIHILGNIFAGSWSADGDAQPNLFHAQELNGTRIFNTQTDGTWELLCTVPVSLSGITTATT